MLRTQMPALLIALVLTATLSGLGLDAAPSGQQPLFSYMGEEVETWARDAAQEPPARLTVYVNHCLYGEEPVTYTDAALIQAVLDALAGLRVDTSGAGPAPAEGSDTHLDFYGKDGAKQSFVFQNGALVMHPGVRDAYLADVEGYAALDALIGHAARTDLLSGYLLEDLPLDGRAIVWDGVTLAMRDDPLDMPGILDGRGGPYLVDDHVAAGLTLSCPVWPGTVLIDEPNHYLAADDAWFVEVLRGESGTLDTYFERNAFAAVQERAFMGIRRHIQGIGFLSGGGRLYLGHALLADNYDAEVVITFGGIGNYEDIRTMAGFLYGAQWLAE